MELYWLSILKMSSFEKVQNETFTWTSGTLVHINVNVLFVLQDQKHENS